MDEGTPNVFGHEENMLTFPVCHEITAFSTEVVTVVFLCIVLS